MSDAAYHVLCESRACYGRGVKYEVSYAAPGRGGHMTYVLVCPGCGGTTAVQDVPEAELQGQAVQAQDEDLSSLLPKSIPADGVSVELQVQRDDPTRPDGKAEREFAEAREQVLDLE